MKRIPMKISPLFLVCALAVATLSGCSGESDQEQDAAAAPSASTSAATEQPSGAASSSPADETPSPLPSKTQEAKTLYDGSTKVFENKRYVALYGVTSGPSLGALGEQSPAQSVRRVQNLVDEYQAFTDEKVQPAFEVIATVASSAPGEDGDFSDESTVESLLPLIEMAEKHGVYVVLDFQPGRSDFLSQIRQYEELLKHPNVGVGFDPEWRLAPGQQPLQQIGSVDSSEINEALAYLADLTEQNELPQKMVVIHQFTDSMITNRELLDTSHEQLALTLHADGHGTPDLKLDTYRTLLKNLPEDIKPSWKNFYDEDIPMLTPEQTYGLDDKPWVVTYQ